MARVIAPTRGTIPAKRLPPTEGLDVVPVTLWAPPRGMNSAATVNRIPPEYARSLSNLVLDKGKFRTRPGIQIVGDPGTGIIDVASFTAEGLGNLLRFTATGIESWNGQTAWTPIAGITWSATPKSFSLAGWGTKLLIANGVDPILAYDVLAGTGQFIAGSPVAQHITVFGGRVVASSVYDPGFYRYRIKWSAKNDYTIWTLPTGAAQPVDGDAAIDKGAGFEDLFSTPGGYIDEVMGVFPITDEIAFAIREYTVWQMSLTGDPIAPFRFSRVEYEVGSRARRGITVVPDGVIFPTSQNDVVFISQNGIKAIGEPVREDMFSDITDPTNLRAAYDPLRQEYRLKTDSFVWRYRFTDQGWTRDTAAISSLGFVRFNNLGLTFDQLSTIAVPDGTFDELPGTFDELSGNARDAAMYFVSADGTAVMREDPSYTKDFSTPDDLIDVPWEIVTGVLESAPLHKTMLVEAQLEYESPVDVNVALDYSLDGGQSWVGYSTITLPAAGPSKISAMRRTLEAQNIQVRLSGITLDPLVIYSFSPFICKGARVRA